MGNSMTSAFNHELYLPENLGISIKECECFLGQMNGLMADMRTPYPPGYLGMQLRAGAKASAAEHAKFGRDLSYPRDDSPEMSAFIAKVATKISEMTPWQQHAITNYAFGFWDGIAAAARDREELMASSTTVPQGWDKV